MLNRNIQLFIVIASSIICLISTDIILPSLPQISAYFSVSANEVKMLISVFMIGQFTTALIWGVIADQIGRRQTLFAGMLLFLAGSLLSLNASSITMLLICRFLQGAGAVVVPVAGWALVQDLYPRDDSVRIMSWIGTLVAIIPLFAPAIGGKIDVLYGWQANLYCIAALSLALCLLMIVLPKQNNPGPKTSNLSLKSKLSVYNQIIRNKTFVSYIALFGLLNCGEWCFLTIAPFYYAHVHIAADAMGLLLMFTSMGFLFGSLLSSRLTRYFSVDKMLKLGIQLALVSSGLLLIGECLHWSDYQLYNATIISIYILSSALLWGGTTSRALQCFEDARGSASAIRSLILLCFSSFGAYSGQLINHTNLYSLGLFMLFMSLSALFIFNNKDFKAERHAHDLVV